MTTPQTPPLVGNRARAALLSVGDGHLIEAADRLDAAAIGAPRAQAAKALFGAVAARAPRLVPVVLESLLFSAAPPLAKVLFTAMALRAVPKDSQVAIVALMQLDRLYPVQDVREEEAAVYLDLISAAWMTQRADLARSLAMIYRGVVPYAGEGLAQQIMAGARFSRFETQLALWQTGGFLGRQGKDRAAGRARDIYGARYPYHRDMSVPDPRGRALVLNLRPYLVADSLHGVHNHSNFPQSYRALNRPRPLAIDVLLLEHLDFDALMDSIAPPDVIVSNLGNAELLERPGLADKINAIAGHFGVRLINPPSKVVGTSRDANWQRIGTSALIEFPKTIRLAGTKKEAEQRAVIAAEMPLPIILRDTTGHMGSAMHLVRDDAGLSAALGVLKGQDVYAIAYHEFQSADGFWRKYRAYLVEGEMVGVHVMTSANWNVHRKGLAALDKERPELGVYAKSNAFGEDPLAQVPAPVWDKLKELLAETGLDAVGVDFALRPDGTALIFEMNSAMRVAGTELVALDAMGAMMERAADATIAARAVAAKSQKKKTKAAKTGVKE